ncbi:MAG: MotA/TolQ/ExbB proton channel family protein [Kiloniellales bacterium]
MASVTASEGAQLRGAIPAGKGPSVDFATLLGVVGGFAIIGLAMVLGGSPGSFINIPALLIVFGGTFLVTTISFTLREVARTQSVLLRAIVYNAETPESASRRMLYLADQARKNGPLSLEGQVKNMPYSRFLSQGISLVADGLPADEIELILGREQQATQERHLRSAGVLRRAGEVAPAMGLIGTLVGLVQMLGNLDDPSSIGPAMAVALLTTFYGAVLANMVFLPLANKLERNSNVEAMVNQIYAIGAASISRQENPRRLEMILNSILSPMQRVNYFD